MCARITRQLAHVLAVGSWKVPRMEMTSRILIRCSFGFGSLPLVGVRRPTRLETLGVVEHRLLDHSGADRRLGGRETTHKPSLNQNSLT